MVSTISRRERIHQTTLNCNITPNISSILQRLFHGGRTEAARQHGTGVWRSLIQLALNTICYSNGVRCRCGWGCYTIQVPVHRHKGLITTVKKEEERSTKPVLCKTPVVQWTRFCTAHIFALLPGGQKEAGFAEAWASTSKLASGPLGLSATSGT